MSDSTKLVLPTVDTCRWRQVRAGSSDAAECGLISRLTGVTSGEFSRVTDDVCAACCDTFPPSPRRLNAVVASMLYQAAEDLIAAGGRSPCSVKQARQLMDIADRSLDFTVPDRFTITPARSKGACCFLGDEIKTFAENGASGEPAFACGHPAHEVATASICRMCQDWTAEQPRSRLLSLPEIVPRPQRRNGGRVSEWAVGVTTAPRRRPMLEECLDSIVRAGWDEPRLFLDGTAPLPSRYDHLPLTWREEGIGAFPAWHLALVELILQQPTADAYFLLQDDVVLYDREPLREYLEGVLWPGKQTGIVTLFYTGLDPRPGWYAVRESWCCGAQGFIFTPEVARRLAADAELIRLGLAAATGGHVRIPETLFEWAARTETEMWYANPSLVQHVGNTSTIWMDSALAGGRRAPWFVGGIETQFSVEEPLDGFPEDVFSAPPELHEAYFSRVERGQRRMREQSVVICGLCRDVRHYLPRTAARIERLGAMFGDWRIVLYENDSADATKEFLLDWRAANPRVQLVMESLGMPRFPQSRNLERAEWLARCRNVCRGHLLAAFGDFSHVIVLDMDLAGGFSFDGLAHTFGEEEWDFVGSYGVAQRLNASTGDSSWDYVDAWAFRPIPDTPPALLPYADELKFERGEPLVPVESCFGGLGVYRMECYAAAEYGGSDCEHVVLHERQRLAGFTRHFLNPSQILLYTPF